MFPRTPARRPCTGYHNRAARRPVSANTGRRGMCRLIAGYTVAMMPSSADSRPGPTHGAWMVFDGLPARGHPQPRGTVRLGLHATPFGRFGLVVQGRTVYAAGFVGGSGAAALVERLHRHWPALEPVEVDGAGDELVAQLLGRRPSGPIGVRLRGSVFQLAVWRRLLDIPRGEVWTYGRLARAVGRPRSCRAVGNAVGANPIAWFLPCHRVVGAGSRLGGYHWGAACKRALLRSEGWEAS